MRKMRAFFRFSIMLISVTILVTGEFFVLFETLRRGVPVLLERGLNKSFLSQGINTVMITLAALCFSMPISVGTAVWLCRTKRKTLKKAMKRVLSALSGVPSAVYGLFGYLLFGGILSMRYSLLSGALTAALLILPPTAFITEAVIKSEDEGTFKSAIALGAEEGKAVFSVLLPSVSGGILNAAFLASSRVAAESAALILTSGIGETLPRNGLFQHFLRSGATLTVGMYRSVLKGDTDLAFSAGVVLILFIFALDEMRKRVKNWHMK